MKNGDVGGLLGIHCRQEEKLAKPLVTIDGIQLKEFDFIDIGQVLRSTGAIPVVVKSLLFPEHEVGASRVGKKMLNFLKVHETVCLQNLAQTLTRFKDAR